MDRSGLPACLPALADPRTATATFACTHLVTYRVITFILLTYVFRYEFMSWTSPFFAFGSLK